jgi:chromosome segregation ATPase
MTCEHNQAHTPVCLSLANTRAHSSDSPAHDAVAAVAAQRPAQKKRCVCVHSDAAKEIVALSQVRAVLLDELRHEQSLRAAAVARAGAAEAHAARLEEDASTRHATHAREIEIFRRSARAWELRAVAAEESVKIMQAEHADRGRRGKQLEADLHTERGRTARLAEEVESLEVQKSAAVHDARREAMRAEALARDVVRLERRAAEAGAAAAQSAAELLRTTVEQHEETVACLQQELDAACARVADAEARQRDADARAQSSEGTRAAIAATVKQHEESIASLRQELDAACARAAHAEDRQLDADARAQSSERTRAALAATVKQHEESIVSLRQELDAERARAADAEAQQRDTEARAQSSERTRAAIAATVVKHAAEQAELKRALEAARAEVASLVSRLDARNAADADAATSLRQELDMARSQLGANATMQSKELEHARVEHTESIERANALEGAAVTARHELEDALLLSQKRLADNDALSAQVAEALAARDSDKAAFDIAIRDRDEKAAVVAAAHAARVGELEEQLEEAERTAAVLEDRCQSVTAKASEFQTEAAELAVLRSRFEEAQAVIADNEQELRRIEEFKVDALSQSEVLTNEVEVLKRQADAAKATERAAKANLKASAAEVQRVAAAYAATEKELSAASDALSQLRRQHDALRADLTAERAKGAALAERASTIEAEASAAVSEASRLRRELDVARAEVRETLDQLHHTEEELGCATHKAYVLQNELDGTREREEELTANAAKLSEQLTVAKTLFTQLKGRNTQLQHELDSLRALNLEYE